MRTLLSRITRLELAAAALAAVVLAVLVVIEPDILQAPFENANTVVFTVGGTVAAAVVLVLMLRWGVPAVVRLAVLGVPFVILSWWLLSPFFMDSVADDDFATTIAAAEAAGVGEDRAGKAGAEPDDAEDPDGADNPNNGGERSAPAPEGPVLLASASFRGLAGHDGRGDAGLFRLPDGRQVLRFENFDIDNGPDLRLYVVPGADQRSIRPGSVSLGKLKGNVGDQTYDLPPDRPLESGAWTVLVWCEAFSVEFVGATLQL